MSYRAGLVSVAAALLALACAVCSGGGARAARSAVSQTLYAGFDADGNIRLTFADGTTIGAPTPPGTVIPAGTYTIDLNNNSLDDLADPHEYHLFGPGVNLSAGSAVQATWTATFQPGSTYVYQDDLNPTTLHEVFGTPGSGATSTTVPSGPSGGPSSSGSVGPGPSPKPTDNNIVGSAIIPFRGTLVGAVGRTGKLTLTTKGRAVSRLKSGRYRFTVTDSNRTGGFIVQKVRKGATTVTGVSFVGKRSSTVNLTAGQWLYYATFVGKKTYFIVVS